MADITSASNDRVKLIRALQSQSKSRRKENRVALEGARLIADATSTGAVPDFVLFCEPLSEAATALLAQLRNEGVVCMEVTEELMRSMSDTETPQNIIAVLPLPHLYAPRTPRLVLLLDGVKDPGNMGTILRTSVAAGVESVVLLPRCVDPFNAKALRSGMGAHFRVPLHSLRWEEVSGAYPDLPLYLADSSGNQPYYAVDWAQPAGVVIGGEARGADRQAHQYVRGVIAIPMQNAAESLNAAMATAVILFECQRQRLTQPGSPA
jgi:TrmH family RNA methyltransferase